MRNPPARVDSNQPEIVAGLRKAGCTIQHLHMVGHGCPDILVGYRGVNYLFEIKDGNGTLTAAEEKWFDNWDGSVYVVRSATQALEIIANSIKVYSGGDK